MLWDYTENINHSFITYYISFLFTYHKAINSIGIVPTVGENIIATIKMRNNVCYPLKMLFFQYCDSNIRLFSMLPI